MKDKLGGEIMTEFVTLGPKTYNYLTDDGDEKKVKRNRTVCHKSKIKIKDYRHCLESNQLDNKIDQ